MNIHWLLPLNGVMNISVHGITFDNLRANGNLNAVGTILRNSHDLMVQGVDHFPDLSP